MKKVLIFLVMFMATTGWGATKVAIVDMQRAVQSTAEGKKAKSDLEGEFDKKKKDFQKREEELKKMGAELEKKKSVMSEEALNKKQAEFQEEVGKYRENVQKSQVEIQKRQADLTTPILQKMKKVIEKVAKEKGYEVVMEKGSGILFAEKSNDLTDDVIKAYEAEK